MIYMDDISKGRRKKIPSLTARLKKNPDVNSKEVSVIDKKNFRYNSIIVDKTLKNPCFRRKKNQIMAKKKQYT